MSAKPEIRAVHFSRPVAHSIWAFAGFLTVLVGTVGHAQNPGNRSSGEKLAQSVDRWERGAGQLTPASGPRSFNVAPTDYAPQIEVWYGGRRVESRKFRSAGVIDLHRHSAPVQTHFHDVRPSQPVLSSPANRQPPRFDRLDDWPPSNTRPSGRHFSRGDHFAEPTRRLPDPPANTAGGVGTWQRKRAATFDPQPTGPTGPAKPDAAADPAYPNSTAPNFDDETADVVEWFSETKTERLNPDAAASLKSPEFFTPILDENPENIVDPIPTTEPPTSATNINSIPQPVSVDAPDLTPNVRLNQGNSVEGHSIVLSELSRRSGSPRDTSGADQVSLPVRTEESPSVPGILLDMLTILVALHGGLFLIGLAFFIVARRQVKAGGQTLKIELVNYADALGEIGRCKIWDELA